MKRIMVIAGTRDSRDIIDKLLKIQAVVVATVTTSFGRELLETYSGIILHEGKLDSAGITALVQQNNVTCIVDASHPFAKAVSVNAMRSCRETGAVYLRFERENTVIVGNGAAEDGRMVIRVRSFAEAAEVAGKITGNILLTIGSKHINVFTKSIPDYKMRLFARILPDSRMVAKCEEAGLSVGHIIALQGPFSEEFNIEMLKYCHAEVLVTKESGEAGGTDRKLNAAAKLGIPVVLVERPEVAYTRKVSTVDEVLEFVKQYI
ncbi:Precorrin-6A reductase [Sporotomaculum syntrophicum]|uniref:Precorrin-6A reductase n=1 Tax=Sporotomaculum syntrophicum TaxID=182264 RepID=A0A9D3AX07_9FIRM|nr:precorrin-6A reductase [Sporotomaculum syntrophicum]KAF1084507.1 Precorrin-6A reductase [Sporotomaculum syntrophicum]